MPDLVVCADGENYLIDSCVSVPWVSGDDWECRLYANDVVPNRDTVLADLTEASFPGYLRKTLARGDWSAAVQISGRAATFFQGTPLSWLSSGTAQLIFGYMVCVAATGRMIWSQRLDTPFLVTNLSPLLLPLAFGGRSESEPPP